MYRLSGLILAVATGCALPETNTVSGEVTSFQGLTTVENGRVVNCRHPAPNADIAEGTPVLVHDKRTDIVVAQGALVLSPNPLGPGGGCTYEYKISGVPDVEMYSIRIEGRPFALTYTRDALEEVGWVVEAIELDGQ